MATVSYQPRGLGFEVVLVAGDMTLRARGEGLDDGDPGVVGSDELAGNVALVTLVLGYAASELAYRRARSPEKRASHRQSAQEQRKDAALLAEHVVRLGERSVSAWCSGCFSRADHRHVKGADRPKRTYLCRQCGTPTVECAVPGCKHHAVMKPRARVALCFCAEHHHQIPGFDKLGAAIPTLGEYDDFLRYEVRNARRITMVAGGTIGAAALVAPMAFLAAPALGAALGSSVLGGSLTGAAATGHGVAMLGGGAIATGGLGIVGGTAVVTATGTALGGALGAGIAAAYADADPSFRIEVVREGDGTPVVFAAGFLTQGRSAWAEWEHLIDTRYPGNPVYQVHWGAKELKELSVLFGSIGAKAAVHAVLAQGAKRGSKAFGLPGLGWVLGVHSVATNPWSIARTRAGMTGAALAALIARTAEGPYVLMGHSLGARVMVSAARALGTRAGPPRIESIHLLGAAVGRRGDWRDLDASASGTVWNYWSANDAVLRWLYTLAEVGDTAAGQAGFKSTFPRIKDRSVSRKVKSHSAYLPSVKLES
jgi:hypothetical protein